MNNQSREIAHKTSLILLAVAINAIEFFIPRIPFFPWLKPGLANCVTILWIVEYGVVDALVFSLLRIWIAGFYFGFSFYAISLSLSGGMCSTLVMGLVWTTLGKRGWMGTVGVGIAGALAHNLTQIMVIYFLLAKNGHLFYQIPIMLVAAIVFGSLTGIIAPMLRTILGEANKDISAGKVPGAVERAHVRLRDSMAAIILFTIGCIVALINDLHVLVFLAVGSAIFAQFVYRGSLRLILSPVTRFWPMFLFIGLIHGLLSYGTRIEGVPVVTYEGVRLTCAQWLKLWTWIELSFSLTHFNFHRIVLNMVQRLFPWNRTTLFAGVLALEYFPAIVTVVQEKARKSILRCMRHPVTGFRAGLLFVSREIERRLNAR
jgi:heptaprenyl diphosphate synthase